ncbi:MAG: hypothetical protein ACXAC7_17445 [Candidatus Hodarchaeales archaeon]|jgi:hypothetical protein
MKFSDLKPIFVLFILLLAIKTTFGAGQSEDVQYPTIDGFWEDNEWKNSRLKLIPLVDSVKHIEFGYRVNDTHIFCTARYEDKTPNIFGYLQDAFAINFDNNGDKKIMGTVNSPDDSVYIGFYGNYSLDVYMRGISKKVNLDTQNEGNNNSYGRFSYSENFFTFEFIKEYNNPDDNGYDINLKKGDSIYVMIAHWDNLRPMTEISGYSDWFKIKIEDPGPPDIMDLIIPIGLVGVVSIVLIYVRWITQIKS